jgi:RND family efflux transporter MFP subunit
MKKGSCVNNRSPSLRLMMVLFFAGNVASACSDASRAPAKQATDAPKPVETEQVRLEQLHRPIDVVGTLAAADDVTISSEAAGTVVRIHADLGDHVRAGQVVVELDREKLQYKLDGQRASLNRALAKYGVTGPDEPLPPIERTPDVLKVATQLAQSELALQRAARLSAATLISQEQLEAAEAKCAADHAAYTSALQNARDLRADIDASRAAVRLAERELGDASVRAPFEGYIQRRFVSQGQFVQVQTPIIGLVRMDPLKLMAEVPEHMAPWVKVGSPVTVGVDAYPDRRLDGIVSRISPAVNQQTRAFPLEATVPNHDGLLKPGTFARARLTSERVTPVLSVPYAAVQNRYGVTRLFIVTGGHVSSVEVKLGDRLGERVEIETGISAGATVVVSDVDRLVEGLVVKATPKTTRTTSGN